MLADDLAARLPETGGLELQAATSTATTASHVRPRSPSLDRPRPGRRGAG
jgi:hypothetical protein